MKNSSNKDLEVKSSVKQLIEIEKQNGLDRLEMFLEFGKKVKSHRSELVGLLEKIKGEGVSIVGYGALRKGNTLLNYCKIGKDMLDYVTDESPARRGKFIPGMHIPIVSPEKIQETNPQFALMIAWSYMEEIMSKEKNFLDKGSRFIVPLPSHKIVP